MSTPLAMPLADPQSSEGSRPRLVVVRAPVSPAVARDPSLYARVLAFAAAALLHAGLLFGFGAPSPAPKPLEVGSPVIELSFAPATELAAPAQATATTPTPAEPVPLTKPKPETKPEARPEHRTTTPQPKPVAQAEQAPQTEPSADSALAAAVASAETSHAAATDTTASTEPLPTTRFTGAPARTTRSYYGQIAGWIDANKEYPVAAKKDKEQGTVVVSFTIDRNGQLLSRSIKKSSGFAQLDEAALATLVRSAPFPPIPDFIGKDTLSIAVPIDYTLVTN